MITEKKLYRLLNNTIKKYNTSVQFLDEVHTMGLSKHACMTIEMLLINRSYDRIKHVLLFTDGSFKGIINEINDLLRNFKFV